MALGDARGAVGLCVLSARRVAVGTPGSLPLDVSRWEGPHTTTSSSSSTTTAPPAAAAAAAVEFVGGEEASVASAGGSSSGSSGGSSKCVCSGAVLCDPLSRGDLFLGSCSGVTGALWAPMASGSAAGVQQHRLVTSGSDGRVTLWSASTAGSSSSSSGGASVGVGAAGAAAPSPSTLPPLLPLAIIATGAVVRCLALFPTSTSSGSGSGGGCGAFVLTCGGTSGEVRFWSLAQALEAAAATGNPALCARDALAATLPTAAATQALLLGSAAGGGGGGAAAAGAASGPGAVEEGAAGGAEASSWPSPSSGAAAAGAAGGGGGAPLQQQPLYTHLHVSTSGSEVRVLAGSRAGGLCVWLGTPQPRETLL